MPPGMTRAARSNRAMEREKERDIAKNLLPSYVVCLTNLLVVFHSEPQVTNRFFVFRTALAWFAHRARGRFRRFESAFCEIGFHRGSPVH